MKWSSSDNLALKELSVMKSLGFLDPMKARRGPGLNAE